MRQVLDPTGELVGPAPDLDNGQLVDMFRMLLTTRMADEKLLNLQRQGRMPAYYQVSGQEAHVGAALALRETDWLFTAYRELGMWLARGMSPISALGLWMGVPDDDDLWDVNRYRVTKLNATIGTHLPHAVGFGYAERLQERDTVAMVAFGDGATSESDFHAAMNFAGVWKTPTVFLCQNNQVAQSTTIDKQTASETLAIKAEAYGFTGELVDGMDPLAMYQTAREAIERAAAGEGPTLIEMHTYRFAPHSTYDGTPVYRTTDEEARWREQDPIIRMRALLVNKGLWEADHEDDMRAGISAELEAFVDQLEARAGVSRDYSPRQLFARTPASLTEQLHREQHDAGEPAASLDPEELWAVEPDPSPTGETRRLDMTEALKLTLHSAFERDPSLVILGEDVGVEGGVFRITEGMHERFGEDRVIDTPLCETGIMGTAVGMAMAGLRPIAEIEFAGFVYPAFDQLIGHVARIRWRYRGHLTAPVVARLPVGTNLDNLEFHTDSPESFFTHAPGLVVVYPSNPYDAKGLLESALCSEDPVVFMEPISLYRGLKQDVPTGPYRIGFGRASVLRAGTDVTVVSWGPPVREALKSAEALAAEGMSAEVIDLRTLYPWDRETVLASVDKTGRLVVAHEAHTTGGFGAEILAAVSEQGLYSLEAPPVRVAHMDVFWGPAQLERYSIITADRITAGIRRALAG
jgi:pyruvate/2-oxoglutarate/acetoin dehydrogenase E1 component/TPP-dependent pyruvate/acetoin dehydrogenase alpha subunit